MEPLAAEAGVQIVLVHVDHAIDSGSAERAARARGLAAELRLPIRVRRVDVPALRRRRESPEAAARRLRYRELEAERAATGASLVLTAHHRDDQIETVLLQILRGAPVEALGGVRDRHGVLRRPLLSVTRSELQFRVDAAGLAPVRDPSNDDLAIPRNRVRLRVLPRLLAAEPALGEALARLARRSASLQRRIEDLFASSLADACRAHPPAPPPGTAGPASRRSRLTAATTGVPELGSGPATWLLRQPAVLRITALRWLLHQRLGIDRLPSRAAVAAFCRSTEQSRPARLRLGEEAGELRFDGASGLSVGRRESRTPPFSYTFSIPGAAELPELGLRLRIRRSGVEAWMLQGDPRRVGFRAEATGATVRSRRPGDRIHPLGAPGERKLKQLLIDRRIPAEERDRLPLVEIGGRIVWVPGVALAEANRLGDDSGCWLAELEPLEATAGPGERNLD